MSRRLVCVCNLVTEKEILQVLRKGALSTADIQRSTRAGTSCGRCLMEIDRMVEEFMEQNPPDAQQRIDFGK
ncbi:MAG TPA: (2Fe-2S)-binding protein [Prolixibacteraceae bacterium]|nr:(2Fe-2S)-binding protein [Prolixibacteraceae bacterium]